MSDQSSTSDVRRESSSPNLSKQFDPVAYELDPNFRLTSYSGTKGRGWKVPQSSLHNMLRSIKEEKDEDEELDANSIYAVPNIGIGMDCSVTPFRHGGLSLIQTTNCIYASVDDPYLQGWIACTNVLSNLYAMGVVECDNILMLFGVSTKMPQKERDVVLPLIMRGFKNCASKAGATIHGGETNINPWLTIGGVATTICQPNEFIIPNAAVPGDVLILTKPIGTQVALVSHQWLDEEADWNRIKLVISKDDTKKAYQRALESMGRLNRSASILMHKYYAHGATDVSGFGLLGHAQDLARNQVNEVSFVIHNLPVIAKMANVAKSCESIFQLFQGRSAEVSGGLLICLPKEKAVAFCKDIMKMEGCPAWIIGVVEKGHRTARIIERPRVIEVPSKETPED